MQIGQWSNAKLGRTVTFSGVDTDTGEWAVRGRVVRIAHHAAAPFATPGGPGAARTVVTLQLPSTSGGDIDVALDSTFDPDDVGP